MIYADLRRWLCADVQSMSALPPKADIRIASDYVRRRSSGSLAIFAAIRRASSRVQFGWCQVTKIESRRSYLTSEKLGKLSSRGSVVSSAPFHGTQRTVRTKLYKSAGGILIWLVALGSTLHRLTMRRWLIWTLFAGVMGFFVGGSFLAALQTPLPTNGAARQTTQTDTSEPILSRPIVISPPISAPARPRNKQHKRAPDRLRRAQ